MDLRQLRYFIAIAEAGSLTKASEALYVAQPALSLQLANLETYLGTKLFDRFSRGVKLTPSGTILLRHAKTILQDVDDATRTVRRTSGHVEGRVSVGLPTTVSSTFVSTFLSRTKSEWPNISLHLTQLSTTALRELLKEGVLDMAVLMNPPEQVSMNNQPLLIEKYCLVSRSDETNGEDSIEWSDIPKLPLLLPSTRSVLRYLIQENADRLGDKLTIKTELDSAHLLLIGVRAGLGHAILPRSYLVSEGEMHGFTVRQIINPELCSSLQLAMSTLLPAKAEQVAIRELLIRTVKEFVLSSNWNAQLHWSMT